MPQGNKTLGTFTLNGNRANAPIEWNTIETLATFDKEAVQANISIDKFTFVNDEATVIRQYIADGLGSGYGIFRGLPLSLEVYNEANHRVIFDGLIDLTDGLEIDEFKNKVKCKLRLRDEMLTLDEKLTCLSYGYLESATKKIFTDGDYAEIQYVVQKKINVMETITTAIMLYIMAKELYEQTYRLSNALADVAALIVTGVTGSVAGALKTVLVAALEVAYTVAIADAVIILAENLINQLIPIRRKSKCLQMRKALEKVAIYLGWKFQSDITDLDTVYYLPSNYSWDETDGSGMISMWVGTPKGIPNTTDYGYNCIDMFDLAKKLFNGKFAIIDGTLCFYNADSSFWIEQSSYVIPSKQENTYTYNTDELQASRIFSFEVENADEHTISEYKGTSYQVITHPLTPVYDINSPDQDTFIRGLDEVRMGVCLASRKDKAYGIENFIKDMAAAMDGIINLFGGSGTYEAKCKDSIGLMIIGVNNYAKPKVVKCNGGMRLVDRDNWSAKYIYETYYKGKSFVETINSIPNYGQKKIYKNVRIPFGMDDYINLISNSYITDSEGKQGKVMSLKWRFSADVADIDYFIREAYTKNLTETFIEPSNIKI